MAGSGYGASVCNSTLKGKGKDARSLCLGPKIPYTTKDKELEKFRMVPEIIAVAHFMQIEVRSQESEWNRVDSLTIGLTDIAI